MTIINIELTSSEAAQYQFLVDGDLEYEESDIIQFPYEHTVIDDGLSHEISIIASNGTDTETFDYSYIVNPNCF